MAATGYGGYMAALAYGGLQVMGLYDMEVIGYGGSSLWSAIGYGC